MMMKKNKDLIDELTEKCQRLEDEKMDNMKRNKDLIDDFEVELRGLG